MIVAITKLDLGGIDEEDGVRKQPVSNWPRKRPQRESRRRYINALAENGLPNGWDKKTIPYYVQTYRRVFGVDQFGRMPSQGL